jgi:hypothetical protein
MKNALVNYKQEVEICEKNAVTECFHFLENQIDITYFEWYLNLQKLTIHYENVIMSEYGI